MSLPTFKQYLNEIIITKLNPIETDCGIISWNKYKSFEKFKSQIEDRIKMTHITEDFLHKILKKGLNLKFNDCYLGTTDKEDDTCLIYSKSQFLVLFNRKGKFIRSIRRISELDKIMCNMKKQVFEVKYGVDNELTRFLEDFNIDLDDTNEGYKFDSILNDVKDEVMIEVNKLCVKCIEIDL